MTFIIGPTLCQVLAIFRLIDLKAIFTSLYFYEKNLVVACNTANVFNIYHDLTQRLKFL